MPENVGWWYITPVILDLEASLARSVCNQDNCDDDASIVSFNVEVLKNVTKEFNRLEIINSASVFELPKEALEDIKDIVNEKEIDNIEVLWSNTDFGVGEINERK